MPEEIPQKRRGRPLKPAPPGTRAALGLKVTPAMKARIEALALENGRSQSQEAERLLELAINWEETRQDIGQMRVAAQAALDAANVAAIRQAGFQIVRDARGPTTVNVSLDELSAAAAGIRSSGFISAEHVDQSALESVIESAVERGIARALANLSNKEG